MRTQLDLESLRSEPDRWALLMTRRNGRQPFTNADASFIVTLTHQGFAISDALVQVARLDQARDTLTRIQGTAGGVAPSTVGVRSIDVLSAATVRVYAAHRKPIELISSVVDPVLARLEAIGVKRRHLRRFRSGRVLAAAFVMLGTQHRGLRMVTPLEMEASVRLCGDRDVSDARPLTAHERAKVREAWKKTFGRARQLLPFLKEICEFRNG